MQSYHQFSDEDIWDKIRQDDEKAFDEFFLRYWKKLHLFVLKKVKDKEATADLVQDLFSNLWQRRHLADIQNVSVYVFAAAKYKCIKFIGTEIANRKNWVLYKKHIPKSEDVTSQTVDYNNLMEELEKVVGDLPEKSRQIFKQSRFEGKSLQQIAQDFNLTEKAIEYHITQSLKRLRIHLKDFYVFAIIFFI